MGGLGRPSVVGHEPLHAPLLAVLIGRVVPPSGVLDHDPVEGLTIEVPFRRAAIVISCGQPRALAPEPTRLTGPTRGEIRWPQTQY